VDVVSVSIRDLSRTDEVLVQHSVVAVGMVGRAASLVYSKQMDSAYAGNCAGCMAVSDEDDIAIFSERRVQAREDTVATSGLRSRIKQ
jgi:hypothetical protein